MNYQFDFMALSPYWGDLFNGLLFTIVISVCSMAVGFGLSILGVLVLERGGRVARMAVNSYVEIIRNTPFLIQLYFFFFGLPSVGLSLNANQAAFLALVINFCAYSIEILRSGVGSIGKGQIEAAMALGLTWFQTFRSVIFIPALRNVYPALVSQFTLLILGTSVVSAISVKDFTSIANDIGSKTFRNFEVYMTVSAGYLSITAAMYFIMDAIGRFVFKYKASR